MPADPAALDVVVVGAGVLGLSIALELAQAGLRVQVLARDLPTDRYSTDFCSPWAGASFSPYAQNSVELVREQRTFARLSELAKTRPDVVAPTTYRYGWNVEGAFPTPMSSAVFTDWRPLTPSTCPRGTTLGVTFSSLTLNPPAFLDYLVSSLSSPNLAHPVRIHRVALPSLSAAFTHLGPVALVVNCTGLGALSLPDVADTRLFPGFGQTITVRAPHVRECLGLKDPRGTEGAAVGEQLYIIPRPGSDGLVTLGGCFVPGQWRTAVDPQRAERILREAYDLCPALADHDEWREGGWKDVHVVRHNAGLRPCREGGMRLELERWELGADGLGRPLPQDEAQQGQSGRATRAWKDLVPRPTLGHGIASASSANADAQLPRQVAVVHAYGVGSSGYQMSLGIAQEVAGIVAAYRAEVPGTTATVGSRAAPVTKSRL